MELNKIIIHEILKDSGVNETEIKLSDELIPNDENSKNLVSTLLQSYNGDKILYAIFDDTGGNYFPERYDIYRNSDRTNIQFIDFTSAVLQNLKRIIKTTTLAKGGYFVFSEYTSNGITFVTVFLIRDKEGKILRKTEHSYAIQTIEYVDTNNLAMACRINEAKLNSGDTNYLTFTQLKQQSISDYFLDWIAVKQLESSREYTKALYEIVNQIEPPIDAETNEPYPIEIFRDKLYSYVKSNPNKTVNLREIGSHFYNNPSYITDFATEHDIVIDTEFRYNRRQLKKFVSVTVNRDGINLKFSRGALNEKVRFSREYENIIIIESKSFVDALRNEISN
ncbi:MAG: nucleoid-associated protein [Candidatus Cloacimonetes bacterium]|nr:nucleoid-associated protein [Candidatus Cloacimonadota bacterium]